MRHLRWLSAVLLTLTAWTVPTQASTEARGGWATTVIDPGTGRFTPGETQTISYWVLQHGTHPYDEGSFGHTLGETGLRLVDSNGTVTTFKGTPLPEPAHFSTSVTLPKTGSWDVYGIQGIFGFDKVGKLTVPGTLD